MVQEIFKETESDLISELEVVQVSSEKWQIQSVIIFSK